VLSKVVMQAVLELITTTSPSEDEKIGEFSFSQGDFTFLTVFVKVGKVRMSAAMACAPAQHFYSSLLSSFGASRAMDQLALISCPPTASCAKTCESLGTATSSSPIPRSGRP
jgi:hypothetical protein